ncbi:MAG: hypothetical protein WC140_05600 [Bacteroidales bacterium]
MKTHKIIIFFIILIGISNSSYAQNKNTYDRNKAMEKFAKQRDKEFDDWRDAANAEFTNYLKESWAAFNVSMGVKDPIGPVPDKPEYYQGIKPLEVMTSHGLPASFNTVSPTIKPCGGISSYVSIEKEVCHINFFGIKKDIPYAKNMYLSNVENSENDVAKAWETLSKSNYRPTLESIHSIDKQCDLSDWARYQLIKSLTEAIYSKDKINERIVSQMFLLCQFKYKVKVGTADSYLVLLLPFVENIYHVPYIDIDGKNLSIFSYNKISSITSLYTYKKDFSASNQIVSLCNNKPMKLGNSDNYEIVDLPLWSKILGRDVKIPINKSFIQFTLNYPQSDLTTYHHSVVDGQTKKYILRQVKYQILKNKYSKKEAVAFILKLIQNGFEYKTDYEMFGRSKPLFIEESIYYKANNCKDRVLIFSWLVKETVGLNTVMLLYPGHVSCGIEFDETVDGDYIMNNDKKYIICDPTFINAPIGSTMTKFIGEIPEIKEI